MSTCDTVPYSNKDGQVKYAVIQSFETKGTTKRVWFHGKTVYGGARVCKPLYKSLELIAKGY